MSIEALFWALANDQVPCTLTYLARGPHVTLEKHNPSSTAQYVITGWAGSQVPCIYITVYDAQHAMITSHSRVVDELAKVSSFVLPRTALSQCEHPVTGLPCFFLHPCRTQQHLDTMARLTGTSASDARVLTLWLKHFGRTVGLVS